MRETRDEIYHFLGPWGRKSKCRIRIYEEVGHLPIILATELPENTGHCITNMVDELASTLWGMYLPRAREGIRWIEHHPPVAATADRVRRHETFDEVMLEIIGPSELASCAWTRLDPAHVRQLVGDIVSNAAQ